MCGLRDLCVVALRMNAGMSSGVALRLLWPAAAAPLSRASLTSGSAGNG